MRAVQWSPGMSLSATEKLIIQNAFQFYGQNKTATAQALGIAIRTLDNKLEKYKRDDLIEEKRVKDGREKRQNDLARARGQLTANGQTPEKAPEVIKASAGVRLEPSTDITEKSAMPMSERSQIQDVLPTDIAADGAGSHG